MRARNIVGAFVITAASVWTIGCASPGNNPHERKLSQTTARPIAEGELVGMSGIPQATTHPSDADDPAGRCLKELGYDSLLTVRVSSLKKSFVIDKIELDLFRTVKSRFDNRLSDIGDTDCTLEIYDKAKARLHNWPLKFRTILFWDDFKHGRGGAQAVTLPEQECSFKYDAELASLVLRGQKGKELQRISLASYLGPEDIQKYRQNYVDRVAAYVRPFGANWNREYFVHLLQADDYGKRAVERFNRISPRDYRILVSEFKPVCDSIRGLSSDYLDQHPEVLKVVILWAVNLAESIQRRESEMGTFTLLEIK